MPPRNVATWTALSRFLGYGPPEPKFLFIGIEERTDPGDELRNLQARLANTRVFGGARADKNVALNALYPGRAPQQVPQWQIAAAIVNEIKRLKPRLGAPTATADTIGTHGGDVFLAELLPVPRSGGCTFPVQHFGFRGETAYYREAIGMDASGRLNPDGVPTPRWVNLRNLVTGQAGQLPTLVVCYSATFAGALERLVSPWVGQPARGLVSNKIKAVGTNASGSVVAVTEFFGGRGRNKITMGDVPNIASAIVAHVP